MRPLDKVPHLELVRCEHIRFHEHPERKRTLRLVERLRDEKLLRNPPIVARAGAQELILLDGANRVSALQELGFSHVPVQVIDYGSRDVALRSWHHLLLEGRALGLQAVYADLPGVRIAPVPQDALETLLELRRVYAIFVDAGASCWGLFPAVAGGPFEVLEWMRVLERVVAAYEGKTRLERIKLADYADLPDVFRSVDPELILFPTLTKFELLHLVHERVMIPTGITRHLIHGRALGLNLGLDFLMQSLSEEDKVQHFARFISGLEMQGRIRFYEESAFIMNE